MPDTHLEPTDQDQELELDPVPQCIHSTKC